MTNEELCTMYQNGDPDALEQLYCKNIKMIEKIIQRYRAFEDLDDLRQESFFGIRKAAALWDPDKFETWIAYAAYWIKASIMRYIDNYSGVVRVPVYQREQVRKYKRAANSYRVQFGREPSDNEIRMLLEISAEQLETLRKGAIALDIRSTSELMSDGETELEDMLPDTKDQYNDLFEKIQHEQLSNTLWGEVDRLPERERTVIRERYIEHKSLRECGDLLGISRERARQIEYRALQNLRRPKAVKALRPYLTESAAYNFGISGGGLRRFNETWESPQERAVAFIEQVEKRINSK